MGGLSQGVSASARGAEKRGTHELAQSDGRPRPDGRDVLSRRVGVSRASGSAGHLSGKPIFRDRERLGLVLLVVVGRWVYTERKVLFRPCELGGSTAGGMASKAGKLVSGNLPSSAQGALLAAHVRRLGIGQRQGADRGGDLRSERLDGLGPMVALPPRASSG